MATAPSSLATRRRMSFDVKNWYWIVAGDETQVYSSASNSFVARNDATLAAWLEAGGRITRIKDMAELTEVLVQRGCAAPAV